MGKIPSRDEYNAGCGCIVFILLLFGLIAGGDYIYWKGYNDCRTQAIDEGYGHMILNKHTGRPAFEFKNKETK